MKKTVKIGFLLLILGIILAIFGIANNGIQTVYWRNGFHIQHRYVQTYQPSQLKSITLKTGSDVVIRSGAKNSVKVVSNMQKPTVEDDAGHLTVKSAAGNYATFNFQLTKSIQDTTVITVAKGTKLDKITAEQGQVGDVSINNLTIKQLALKMRGDLNLTAVAIEQPLTDISASDATLTKVTAPSLALNSDGEVHVDRSHFDQATSSVTSNDEVTLRQTSLKGGQLTTSDSDVSLLNNQLAEQLVVKTTDGDIHVTADKAAGINASTTDGTLHVFDWHQDDAKSYQVQPQAKQQYQLSTTDGDITVQAVS
ncbi:DUF4097 family beta strand repeat-containing protein [Lactiplantibacillus daoliensis]|uniref:DUF4097 family beta strand repeat-containing protein n=1 Tax=Lactiplantibacillus daoliensis TaxID=2559916 RepID=A0ABW1UI11_9LACO|nr:DUF4097 family beta strand repeat-containing protein [Lactiplantibacillus daoliensis]